MKIIIIYLFFLQFVLGEEPTPEQIEKLDRALETWRVLEEGPGNRSHEEYIEVLGRGLRKTSNDTIFYQGGADEVHEILKAKLLSIPGHAEYFGNRINEEREKVDRLRAEGNEYATTSDLYHAQRYGFETLSYLPSVETVRVLGSFLEDDRGKDRMFGPSGERSGEFPNRGFAAQTLAQLPIANKPATDPEDVRKGTTVLSATYLKWFKEVESGKRTFRFIGDPVDYDLRGPSKRGAVEPTYSRSGKQVAEGTKQAESKITDEKRPSAPLIGYVLAGFFLVAGAWFYIRKRKAA